MIQSTNKMNRRLPFVGLLTTEQVNTIYEFIGPCPKALSAKKNTIELFRSGRIGIPSWEITMNHNTFYYTYNIPNYDYYEFIKIKNNKWTGWNEDNLLYTKQQPIDTYTHIFRTHVQTLPTKIRNDIFLMPGETYFKNYEGSFDTPAVPVPYSFMNDYDIIYTLKQARNNTQEGIKNWVEFKKSMGYNNNYLERILNKWQNIIKLLQPIRS
jgi:hypothetical protein